MDKVHPVSSKEHSVVLAPPRIKERRSINRSLRYIPVHQNRLIAEANKVFTIIARLKHKVSTDFKRLKEILFAEVEKFEEKIKFLGYDDDHIFVIYNALDICIEEVLKLYSSGRKGRTSSQKSARKVSDQQRFFDILETMYQEPQKFIDTIELVYICLNLGADSQILEGNEEGKQTVSNMYQVIRGQRGEFEKRLSSFIPQVAAVCPPESKTKPPFLSVFGILLTTVLVVFGMYSGTNYLLKVSSKQLSQELKSVVKVTDSMMTYTR